MTDGNESRGKIPSEKDGTERRPSPLGRLGPDSRLSVDVYRCLNYIYLYGVYTYIVRIYIYIYLFIECIYFIYTVYIYSMYIYIYTLYMYVIIYIMDYALYIVKLTIITVMDHYRWCCPL